MSKLYRIGEVAKIIERTPQTIRLWEKWSDELEKQGKPRLIPKPIRIELGKKTERRFTEEHLNYIIEFVKNMKNGDLSKFTSKRYIQKLKRRDNNGEV